ncbi:Ger(x)C family spore germination protein [Lysinibacillus piscis]|uniref:Ger(X)C family spore germination protein n=1 Tax=Lysinibacillus piscis TaxID=2518931 RepID=A0ABQ5NLL1_9BACI|nr:Ger(x)C family spore germination protein [Lysinibacillus sp. KH24]GLC89192.1 hypothetical protein LYSBPC_23190 [Lysinibacillus sp. KH24]
MKKKRFFLISLLTLPLLTGCWDVAEPQRMYYINGVGVDMKDGEYEIYLQIINFANVAKSEQPNTDAPIAEIGHATGKTMEEAFFKLYRSVDQEMFWGHMTYLLLSEEALKHEKAIAIIDSALRFQQTRYQIWTYCTQESIKEIMLVTPLLDKSLNASKLSNPLNTEKQETFIEPINLRKLVIGLNEPSHEIAIPYVSLNSNWASTEGASQETTLSGVGILSKDGFKGFIKGEAVRGMQWMTDETKRGELTFQLAEEEEDYLTVTLQKINVHVQPIVEKDGQPVFDIDVKFNATVNGFKSKVAPDDIRKKIIEEAKKEILLTYTEGLKKDVDIYRLSEHLYRKNVKIWKKLEKDGKIPLTANSIGHVNIHVNKVQLGRKTFEETIKE